MNSNFFFVPRLLLTTCVSVVADFKVLTFQFINKLCTKILTLNLSQNPQLRLHFVVRSLFFFQLPFFQSTKQE